MRLAIMGAGGRMGRELIRLIHKSPHCGVAGAVERPDSPSSARMRAKLPALSLSA